MIEVNYQNEKNALYKVDNNYNLHKKIPVIGFPSCFSLDKPSSTNRQPQQQSMSSSVIL